MNELSFRICAIWLLSFDAGISTRRCFAWHALRMRVSMSAIGSVILIGLAPLPAGLADARDEPLERHVAEGNAAQPELAQVRALPAAHRAPVANAYVRRVARHLAQRDVRLGTLLLGRRRALDDRLEL